MKRLIAILLLCSAPAFCGTPAPTASICDGGGASSTTATCRASMSVTNGNLVACTYSSALNAKPAMSNTGTATVAWGVSSGGFVFDGSNNQNIGLATATVSGTGTLIPTATWTGSSFSSIICQEYTNTQALGDGATGLAATATTAANGVKSGQITTTKNGNLLVGSTTDDGGTNPTITAGTLSQAFTKILCGNEVNLGNDVCQEYAVQAAAASATEADWTSNQADAYATTIVALQATAGGAAAAGVNMSQKRARCEE